MSLPWRPRRLVHSLALVVAFAFFLQYAFYAVFFPWSVPLPGKAALTGSWYGDWPGVPSGAQHLAMELEPMTQRCTAPCSRLDAVARICSPNGAVEYDGHGSVRNWSGSRFFLSFAPRDASAAAVAPSFRVEGRWRGREVDATIVVGPLPRSSVTVDESRGPPPPATPSRIQLVRESRATAAACTPD